MITRHAKYYDIDRLELLAAVLGVDTSGHPFSMQVDAPGHAVFVVEHRDRLVAVLSLRDRSGPLRESFSAPAQLWGLYVHPDVQGQGVARTLMGRGLVYAHMRNYDVIWATSSATNGRAIAFLGKCGFRQLGPSELVATPESEVVLACVLA